MMTNIDAGRQHIRRLPDRPIVGETYPNAGGVYKVDRYDAERDLAWVHRPKDGWRCCAHGPALYDVPGRGMVLSMGSYFQDNPPTPEEIAKWRADLTRGWPYTEDDPEPDFFDWTPDPDRSATTDSIYLLKATGNWTAEDERIAFDPSKPPPRPLAELEAEHDAFLKELFKKAKPL